MEFLNPAAIYALFFLPLLLIPYLLRRRRRIVFSSHLLLIGISPGSSTRRWARLRLPLMFFLQLVFFALLILALGNPAIRTPYPEKIAVVLDNSASMQAAKGGKSRFELAKEKARGLVDNFPPDARLTLFLTVPGLKAIGTNVSPTTALRLLNPLQPYDLAEPRGEYDKILFSLTEKGGYDRIFFFTDYRVREPGEQVEVHSVGEPQGNVAITLLKVTRSLASGETQATVEVANFDSIAHRVQLSLRGEGRAMATQVVAVAAGETATVFFGGLPHGSVYDARLQFKDALELDNVRFAVLPALQGLSILGVSPQKDALQSLGGIPGVRLKVISPQAYQRNGSDGQALEIFHYSAPQALPGSDALFVLPPKGNPLVDLGEPLRLPTITDWRDPHPLTRYVNFTLLRPVYARPVLPPAVGNKIIDGPSGPLAVELRHRSFRYLVLGFDPFPYLARANLPMSIFTLNLLNWFFAGFGDANGPTGEPLGLPGHTGVTVVDPRGGKTRVAAGGEAFADTFYQGLYRVTQGAVKMVRAVNFSDAGESDLRQVPGLKLKRAARSPTPRIHDRPLWIYFVLLAAVVLLLEWFLDSNGRPAVFSLPRHPGERHA